MGSISDKLKKQAEQKAKQMKKKIIAKIAPFLIKGLIIILAGCLLLGIFNAITNKLAELISQIGNFASSIWVWITDDYWIDIDEYITITAEDGTEKSQTLVEHYMEQMESLGVSLESLKLLGEVDYSDPELVDSPANKMLKQKYLYEFIRADLISQEIHRRRGNDLVNSNDNSEVDGGVYLYRTKANAISGSNISNTQNTNTTQTETKIENKIDIDDDCFRMEYKEFEEFQAYKNGQDYTEAREIFTIDPTTKELLFYEVDIVTESKYEYNKYDRPDEYTITLREQRVDYRSYIQRYTMPFEFLINLCMITQNPEFVLHVAYLARNTHIELIILDNLQEEEYTEDIVGHYYHYQPYSEKIDCKTEGKTKITKTNTATLVVGKADAWSYRVRNTYMSQVTQNAPVVEEYSIDDLERDEDVGSIKITDRVKTTSTITKSTEIEYSSTIETKKSKQFLGLLRNETGKCYDQDSIKNCLDNAVFKKNGYNVAYRIPNTTKEEAPLSKLQSGEQMLYNLLEIQNTNRQGSSSYNAKMQGLKEYMQYIMTFPEDDWTYLQNDDLNILLNGGNNNTLTYGTFGWPLNPNINYRITSPFGMRDIPIEGATANHQGIDIGRIDVGTDIIAAGDGIVRKAEYNDSYGYYISIEHQNGYRTLYAHNSELLVNTGQTVTKGQKIAKAGSTGASTGTHLHFEVIVNGMRVNPLYYVPLEYASADR